MGYYVSMAQKSETKKTYILLVTNPKPFESFLSIETFRVYVSMLQFGMVNSLALNFSVYWALVSWVKLWDIWMVIVHDLRCTSQGRRQQILLAWPLDYFSSNWNRQMLQKASTTLANLGKSKGLPVFPISETLRPVGKTRGWVVVDVEGS